MQLPNHKSLRKSILALEKLYPKDDLITSYPNFLKHRDYLTQYRFNPILFQHILRLATDLWTTDKRINRISLLQAINAYGNLFKIDNNNSGYYYRSFRTVTHYPPETTELLFELFKLVFDMPQHILSTQIEEARKLCNSILIGVQLTRSDEEWLCLKSVESPTIINRILRYPVKSKVISQWARENFLEDGLRNRRAELISWILDEDASFALDKQLLIDDFEYMNKMDTIAIKKHNDELFANSVIENALNNQFPDETPTYGLSGQISKFKGFTQPRPQLNLPRRFYLIPMLEDQEFDRVPDMKKLTKQFHENLELYTKVTMIGAIGYSRLSNRTKSSLLKKYYCNETYSCMLKVCSKNKNLPHLKWMLAQS